eukprot:656621-Lingulodinium_polyedra.AAC.1
MRANNAQTCAGAWTNDPVGNAATRPSRSRGNGGRATASPLRRIWAAAGAIGCRPRPGTGRTRCGAGGDGPTGRLPSSRPSNAARDSLRGAAAPAARGRATWPQPHQGCCSGGCARGRWRCRA